MPTFRHRRRDDIPLEQFSKVKEHRRAYRRSEHGFLYRWRKWIYAVLSVCVLLSVYFGVRHWMIRYIPPPSYIEESIDNMTTILEALRAYHLANDHFPPAYLVNDRGEQTVSWRVLLLPYFRDESGFQIYKGLYEQFRLDETWEHPMNRRLLAQMPLVYLSPASKMNLTDGRTNYVCIRNTNSVFPGDTPLQESDISDPLKDTVALVEISDEQCVWWTQPEDFRFEPFSQMLSSPILTHDGHGLVCGMCNYTARFIRVPYDPRTELFGIHLQEKKVVTPFGDKELVEKNPWTYLFLRNNGIAPPPSAEELKREEEFDPRRYELDMKPLPAPKEKEPEIITEENMRLPRLTE